MSSQLHLPGEFREGLCLKRRRKEEEEKIEGREEIREIWGKEGGRKGARKGGSTQR